MNDDVCESDLEKCNTIKQNVEEAIKKFTKVLKRLEIICEENFLVKQNCDKLLSPVTVYLRNEDSEDLIKFDGKPFTSDIVNFFNNNIKSIVQKIISLDNFYDFFKIKAIPKLMVFGEKSTVPLMLRLLSHVYADRLLVGYVSSSNKDIVKRYKVNKFPHVLGLTFNKTIDNYSHIDYDQLGTTYEKVDGFCSKFVLKERINEYDTNDLFDLEKREEENVVERLLSGLLLDDKSEESLMNDERGALLLVWDGELDSSIQNRSSYVSIMKKTGKMLNYGIIRSSHSLGKNNTMVLLPMGSASYKVQDKHHLSHSSSSESVISRLQQTMEDKTVHMQADTMDRMVSMTVQQKKTALVLFTDGGPVSLTIRAFANQEKYQKYINYFTFESPDENLKKKLQITKLPAVFMFFLDTQMMADYSQNRDPEKQYSIQTGKYQGKLQYHLMESFIDQLEVMGGKTPDTKEGDEQEKQKQQQFVVDYIQSQGDFEQCNRRTKCILLLLDMSESESAYEKINVLKEAQKQKNNQHVFFGYIDARCHHEVLDQIGVEQTLPQLVYFQPESQDYVAHIGTINTPNVVRFLTKVLNYKTNALSINIQPFLARKDCKTFHQEEKQKLKKQQLESVQDDDDEILQEILEQEKRKRQLIEDQLKEEGIVQDKKKKKKKGRKTDL